METMSPIAINYYMNVDVATQTIARHIEYLIILIQLQLFKVNNKNKKGEI